MVNGKLARCSSAPASAVKRRPRMPRRWAGVGPRRVRSAALSAERMRAGGRRMRQAGGAGVVVGGWTAGAQLVVTWSAVEAGVGVLSSLVEVAAAQLRKNRISLEVLHPSNTNPDFVRGFLREAKSPD